jgi:hypothetical protein
VLGHVALGRPPRARMRRAAPSARRWAILGVNDVNIILYDVLLCTGVYVYI